MHPRDKIVHLLKKEKMANGRELAELLGFTRQALNKHMKVLLRTGMVTKHGHTRGAYYSLVNLGGKAVSDSRPSGSLQTFKKEYRLDGLEEHNVFEQVALLTGLRNRLNRNAYAIVEYAFTEILNNAVEHSRSKTADVMVTVDQGRLCFQVRDYGIGIFDSIRRKLRLSDEPVAVGELIKGKTTTMPERHTGEGLFFTSKSGDELTLKSHKIGLVFSNAKKDVFVQETRFLKGTDVTFEISTQSKRKLEALFKEYAPEKFDYKFERTRVYVKLFAAEYVSRSEAKRLLAGLDKFREIVLDFKGVRSIGQGFADETFRVFAQAHPHIRLQTENVSPALQSMISHVVDNKNMS